MNVLVRELVREGMVSPSTCSVRRTVRRIFEKNPVFIAFFGHAKLNVTIRREMGSDIDAACGQLRNKNKGVSETQ